MWAPLSGPVLSVSSGSAVFVRLTVGLTIISKQRKSPHIHKARTSEGLLFLAWPVSLVHQFGSD